MVEAGVFIDFFVPLYSTQSKTVGWNKRSGSTSRRKEQQIVSALTIRTLMQQLLTTGKRRLQEDIDS